MLVAGVVTGSGPERAVSGANGQEKSKKIKARRYALNTNLIHTRLRDPRFAPDTEARVGADALEGTFYLIEVAGVSSSPAEHSSPVPNGPVTAQRVDITLSDGRRILVGGATALSAIMALVERQAQ